MMNSIDKDINLIAKEITEMLNEISRLKEKIKTLNYTREDLENKIGLTTQIMNNELDVDNPIEVPVNIFCDIYEKCIDEYFELRDEGGKENEEKAGHIIDSYFYIQWNGIKCKFGNGASVSNYFIPGLRDTWEEE